MIISQRDVIHINFTPKIYNISLSSTVRTRKKAGISDMQIRQFGNKLFHPVRISSFFYSIYARPFVYIYASICMPLYVYGLPVGETLKNT